MVLSKTNIESLIRRVGRGGTSSIWEVSRQKWVEKRTKSTKCTIIASIIVAPLLIELMKDSFSFRTCSPPWCLTYALPIAVEIAASLSSFGSHAKID